MAEPGRKGLARILAALRYSLQGLASCWRMEASFRLEVLVFVFMIPAGLWLGENGSEKALLVGSVFLVLIVEIVNSAIEAVVDRIGEEYHVLSGCAKDLASAAVFVSMLQLIVVWALLLIY